MTNVLTKRTLTHKTSLYFLTAETDLKTVLIYVTRRF